MKKSASAFVILCLLSFALFAQSGGAPKASDRETIAVYIAGQESKESEGMHRVLGGELAKAISGSGRYSAVDRTSQVLAQLDREQVYQRSGAVEDEQIKELGKQLAVQYLCIAEVSAVRGGKYYLDVRLVNVETAEIAAGVTEHSTLEDSNEMIRVAQKIAAELIAKNEPARTAEAGQQQPDQTAEQIAAGGEPEQSAPKGHGRTQADGGRLDSEARSGGRAAVPMDYVTRYGIRLSGSYIAGEKSNTDGGWSKSETKGWSFSPGIVISAPLFGRVLSLNHEINLDIRSMDMAVRFAGDDADTKCEMSELVVNFPATLRFEFFNFFIESGLRFDYQLRYEAGNGSLAVRRTEAGMGCVFGAGYAFSISSVRFYPGYRVEVNMTKYDERDYFKFLQHTFGLTALFNSRR